MPKTVPLVHYLFNRLHQLGIRHIFGVPGDFTLKALDHVPKARLRWIGNCNELNAGYAADGYARIRGASALFTTYGVGELSAINAVAGSYAEYVPVIHVVGTPQWKVQQSRQCVHHTLGDGRFRLFKECAEKFSVAQANLIDATEAPELTDKTIEAGITFSRPVYIELPCDMVMKSVPSDRLGTHPLINRISPNPEEQEQAKDLILQRIYAAKKPLILVDRGHGVQHHIQLEIIEFVKRTKIPTLAMPSGNGMIPHSLENYYGVHSGEVGQIDTMPYVESADLVLAFGPMFSDTQTLGFKVVPDPKKTITICKSSMVDGLSGRAIRIDSKSFMNSLLAVPEIGRLPYSPDTESLGDFRKGALTSANDGDPKSTIDQSTLYLRLSSLLRRDDIVLLGNATPLLGGRDLVLPLKAYMIASGIWFSIGHMLPAALGAAMAQQQTDVANSNKKRTVLIEGDGNLQISVQEISTILRHRLNITIFVINNGGYAYERQIHGLDEEYNDLHEWRYTDAAQFFGAQADSEDYPVKTCSIRTSEDLESFIAENKIDQRPGFRLVEIKVGKYDVPEKFKMMFKAAATRL